MANCEFQNYCVKMGVKIKTITKAYYSLLNN